MGEDDVTRNIELGLLALQHRGQEAFGIYTFDGLTFHHRKQMGLVRDLQRSNDLRGKTGIGHVRYSTAGKRANQALYDDPSKIEEFAQPYFSDHPRGGFALCHNGNIVNYPTLSTDLRSKGTFLSASCDTEVMLKMLADAISDGDNLETAVRTCMNKFEGAYSVVALTGKGELIAFRDPHGFRPLCFGRNENLLMIASESVALDINRIPSHSNVNPGELIIVRENEQPERIQILNLNTHARCMFEYVYFSRPDSKIDDRDVYSARIMLGRNLAHTYKTNADVIVPVPDTARPAAEGISQETGIPVLEGLIKNRYVARTFIMPNQEGRENAVMLKLNAVTAVVRNKNLLLVDDSIVRGTTMRKIISLLKNAGARRVEVWITCPPIKSPCFYGIDMPTHSELIASTLSIEQVRQAVGADELCYQTIEGLLDAIGFAENETCLACLTGKYPTPLAQKIANEKDADHPDQGIRSWETQK